MSAGAERFPWLDAGDGKPYFRESAGELVPAPHACAPWSESMLHGRLMVALAARAIEREHGDSDFQCARFTIDLFRAAPMEPVRIRTRTVRSGGRVRVVDAEIAAGGVEVARATALLLRRGEQPPVAPWRPGEWTMPPPHRLEPLDDVHARFLRMDVRPAVRGSFFHPGQRRLWFREEAELVEGEAWTPFTRVAGVADIANPVANRTEEPLRFINADVTFYLHRLPADEWLGLEVIDHLSDAGIAVGACSIYDTAGRIGWCSLAGIATAAPSI